MINRERLRSPAVALALVVVAGATATIEAGERGPGPYAGTVVFDRWGACMLYGGVQVMYVSEKVKEQLRPYAGQAVLIEATDVYQPKNPGDGLIRAFEYRGPAMAAPSYLVVRGLQLRSAVRADQDGLPVAIMTLANVGSDTVKVFSSELAPTLMTRGKAAEWTPFDGPSHALITRQSFWVGGPTWHNTFWTIGRENALPETFELAAGEQKTIEMHFHPPGSEFQLPDGEYDFLCGYGSWHRDGLTGNLAGFDLQDGKFVSLRERPLQRPTISVSRWPASDQWLVGRLAIEDHGLKQTARVHSIHVEVKNRTGHAADLTFDPANLKLEVFAADGSLVPEDAAVIRSGPVPQAHHVRLSPDSSSSLPTYRGGIGLPPGKTLLAAGWQTWTLAPGRYTIKGSAEVQVSFAEEVLDPLLPVRSKRSGNPQSVQAQPPQQIPPVGQARSLRIELAEVRFDIE